jgi:hypothetical protein
MRYGNELPPVRWWVISEGQAMLGFASRAHASKKSPFMQTFYTFYYRENDFRMICLDQKDVKQ